MAVSKAKKQSDNVDILQNELLKLNNEAWKCHVNQPSKAFELASKAEKIAQKTGNKSGLAQAFLNKGVSSRYLSKLEDAVVYCSDAKQLFIDLDDRSGEASASVSLAAMYYYMGDYEKATDFFSKSLNLYRELDDDFGKATSLNGLGYIVGLSGDEKNSLAFLHEALTLSDKVDDGILKAKILDSTAFVYFHFQRLDKALEYYKKCYAFTKEEKDYVHQSYALSGMADIFANRKKFDKAKKFYTEALEIRDKIGYKVGKAETLLHLGKLLFETGDHKTAEKHFLDSLKVANSIKAKAQIYQAHKELAGLYEFHEDMKNFVHHFKLYFEFKSEVFKEELENKQKTVNLQYEMDKLKRESELNHLTNVVLKEKNAELEQSYDNLNMLSQMGKEITSSLQLDQILNTVYEKVNKMMDASIFGIGIYDKENALIHYQLAMANGVKYQPYTRTMEDKNQFPVWCVENKKEVFINDIRNEYKNYLSEYAIEDESKHKLEDGTKASFPISMIYLPLISKEGIIGLITVQSHKKDAYTENHLNILRTLASHASAALSNATSYEALQHTLDDLKVAHEQLVQAEKLASLGQLTAGIAHEIKNPLNFVNNFAELSIELIDELKDTTDPEEVDAIMRDIKGNLSKIYQHGKRADGIVKSMLQHSRSSKGEKQPTDINRLCQEYFNLAYHGMRANIKNFNCNMVEEYDSNLKQVSLIQQDISRVLLNLINNAFYAVNGIKDPEVSIKTSQNNGYFVIKVRDNGIGIPEAIKKKIFEPFFTTKPTGQGTGLGLSLSYDIIKAHGGKLEVDSVPEQFTEFIISLPEG